MSENRQDEWKFIQDRFEIISQIGEGSYGEVMKCRNKVTGQIVAVKRFIGDLEDQQMQKVVQREIKALRSLRHENLVNMLELFQKKRKKKIFLIFEYVDHTVLEEMNPPNNPIPQENCRKYIYQVIRAINFCHSRGFVHRDVKPENILITENGIIKLCDFGFARGMPLRDKDPAMSDYVATRWYRSPEILVGDPTYSREVDVWAIACLHAEMLTSNPLFPGETDIDQLSHIIRCLGPLPESQLQYAMSNPRYSSTEFPQGPVKSESLEARFAHFGEHTLSFLQDMLQLVPQDRPSCSQLLSHAYFTWDGFSEKFLPELKSTIYRELKEKSRFTIRERSKSGKLHKVKVGKQLQEPSLEEATPQEKRTVHIQQQRFMPPINISPSTPPSFRAEPRLAGSNQPGVSSSDKLSNDDCSKRMRRVHIREELILPDLSQTNEIVSKPQSKPKRKSIPSMPHITNLKPFGENPN